jgi:outer membrane lipoprotein LolB
LRKISLFALRALLSMAAIFSAGCATVPPVNAPDAAGAASIARTGRISVRSADAQGAVQSWHAGFEYVERSAARSLKLTDPLGSTLAQIEADARGARMTTANGQQQAYGSLAELTQRLTGVPLPEAAWRYWLDGVPAPNLTAQQGAASGFGQAGFWINVISRFAGNAPRVIEITRPESPDLLVRVALDAAN